MDLHDDVGYQKTQFERIYGGGRGVSWTYIIRQHDDVRHQGAQFRDDLTLKDMMRGTREPSFGACGFGDFTLLKQLEDGHYYLLRLLDVGHQTVQFGVVTLPCKMI